MKTIALVFLALCALISQNTFAQTYSAEQLYKERRNNRQTFEKKYFNQTFTVAGKIWNITPCSVELPGFKNYHKIALTGTGYEIFIICQIPFSEKEMLNQFKTGQVMTVTGTYNEKALDFVLLNDCTFKAPREEGETRKGAPLQIPLGNYTVYQQSGTGFSFQYQFHLKSYTSYTMNGKTGSAKYDKKAGTIGFTTGLLKGFKGLYRPANPTNENDPPTIVLDPKGGIPDLKRITAGYQYAYFNDQTK